MEGVIKPACDGEVQKDLDGIEVFSSDGALLKGVKLSLNHTVEKLKEGLKPSVFARCFPMLANKYENALQEIRRKTLEPLVKTLSSDLSDVVKENLADSLNKLHSINKKTNLPQSVVAWRPSGNPEMDIISHDIQVLRYEKQKLIKILESHKNSRQKLFEATKAGRMQCYKNHLQIQLQMKKLEPTQTLCNDFKSEELEKELENLQG